MSILVGKDTRVLIQGLGKTGQFHTEKAIAYGTQMVGAVHPSRKGSVAHFEGETDQSGVPGRDDTYSVDLPVFATVEEAVAATGANASVVYVPPPFAADAIMEAASAGLDLVVAITEGVPVADMIKAKRYLADKPTRLVGPNCPGVITPGECKIGIMPGYIHERGPGGGDLPFGDPDLRGGLPADAQRAGTDDRSRDRRRPGQRDQLRRHAPPCSRRTPRPRV